MAKHWLVVLNMVTLWHGHAVWCPWNYRLEIVLCFRWFTCWCCGWLHNTEVFKVCTFLARC